jgi:hypothetical protein
VAAAAGESEFHVSRKIIHFPSLRWNTVMYFPAFTAAPDLSVGLVGAPPPREIA